MKNAVKVFLVIYITLFISYSCQHQETFTPDMGTQSIVSSNTCMPCHSDVQDSIQYLNTQNDSGELASQRVFHNDISAGDPFAGF